MAELRKQLRAVERSEPVTGVDPSTTTATRTEDERRSDSTDLPSPASDGTGDNTVPLAQQLQLIEKFSGATVNDRAESFKDWLEQFEVIADAFSWSQRVKLMGLAI